MHFKCKFKMDKFDQQECFLLIFACIFGVASFFLFFGLFVPLTISNKSYQEGVCYGTKGKADVRKCEYKVCWSVYQGIIAVPNITSYVWKGFYLNHDDVVQIVDGNIGKYLGKCWYKSGGTQIVMKLHNAEVILLISLMILLVAIFTCIIIIVKILKIPKCCKRRTSNYTELESIPLV